MSQKQSKSAKAKRESESRYSFRQSSKQPARFRDYVVNSDAGAVQQPQETTQSIGSSSQQRQPQTRRSYTPRKQQVVQVQQQPFQGGEMPPPVQIIIERERQTPQSFISQSGTPTGFGGDVQIGAEQEVSTSLVDEYVPYQRQRRARQPKQKQTARYLKYERPAQPVTTVIAADKRYNAITELSEELKMNLRKLKNILKLPKARRFVFCEFFYSGVDEQLFLAENEFSQLLAESFPNLKCKKLRKPEWREVRRLIGKPRRCSQNFLNEERAALEEKRQKIRSIYAGTCTMLTLTDDDLPAFLPRPPVVGQKIYARVRNPKDGIYAATVDAISADGYRVVFEDENIPACTIKDFEVMFDQPSELLSIQYFIEQNRAISRASKGTGSVTQLGHYYPKAGFVPVAYDAYTGKMVPKLEVAPRAFTADEMEPPKKKVALAKDEKVGNFPVRMLVILVKLCKVIEYKKQLVGRLTLMNDCAEKMNMLGSQYPHEFQIQFSQLVLDLETVNRHFHNYLAALQTHYDTLLPHLNEPQSTDKPELLRKTCNTHAFQIVKHCNTEVNVKDKRILHLITSLTSLMLQHKKKFSVADKHILSESLKQIRSQCAPTNAAAFQDHVEVHMRQMLKMMVRQ